MRQPCVLLELMKLQELFVSFSLSTQLIRAFNWYYNSEVFQEFNFVWILLCNYLLILITKRSMNSTIMLVILMKCFHLHFTAINF